MLLQCPQSICPLPHIIQLASVHEQQLDLAMLQHFDYQLGAPEVEPQVLALVRPKQINLYQRNEEIWLTPTLEQQLLEESLALSLLHKFIHTIASICTYG